MAASDHHSDISIDTLLRLIRDRRLRAGDQLPSIRDLAADWQVNASVVRTCLLQAEAIGIIEMRPRSGAFVADFSVTKALSSLSVIFDIAIEQRDPRMAQLYELRIVLETDAAARVVARLRRDPSTRDADLYEVRAALDRFCVAADRQTQLDADTDFHLSIARLAENPALDAILRVLIGMQRSRRTQRQLSAREHHHLIAEHDAIYRALLAGDTAAVDLLGRHISSGRDAYLSGVHTQPLPVPPAATS